MSDRKKRTVKWFDTFKGYGFIELEVTRYLFTFLKSMKKVTNL